MFDIRSMFLVAALTALACSVVLWSMRHDHRPSRNGLVVGAVAEGCMAVAMLLIALRGIVPDTLSVFVANSLGTVGGLLLYDAARRLCGARPATWLLLSGSLLLVGLHAYWGNDPAYHLERLCLTSIVQSGAALGCVPLLLARRGRDASLPIKWGVAFGTAYSAAHLVRLVVSLNTGVEVEPGGMVSGNLTIVSMAAFFSAAPMIFAMVMIGLVNGRLAYEFRRQATTDVLTGLPTRRNFFETAERELALARTDDFNVSVFMMLDLDHFKKINDTLGHPAGDATLARFARIMRDNSPPDVILGRYGGEEFCIFLPRTTRNAALRLATLVCECTRALVLDNSVEPQRATLRATVSIGIATAPDDGKSISDLLMAADRRVYLAKANGRDQVFARDQQPDLPGSDRAPVIDMVVV